MKKLLILLGVISGVSLANSIDPHTLGDIQTQENAWQVSFSTINEAQFAEFSDAQGNKINPGETISVNKDFKYGFSFLNGADFDIAYAVTAVRKLQPIAYPSGNAKCVLIVTAKSAGLPEVSVSNFQGAQCVVNDTATSAGTLILKSNVS